jgi:hypothetical protein
MRWSSWVCTSTLSRVRFCSSRNRSSGSSLASITRSSRCSSMAGPHGGRAHHAARATTAVAAHLAAARCTCRTWRCVSPCAPVRRRGRWGTASRPCASTARSPCAPSRPADARAPCCPSGSPSGCCSGTLPRVGPGVLHVGRGVGVHDLVLHPAALDGGRPGSPAWAPRPARRGCPARPDPPAPKGFSARQRVSAASARSRGVAVDSGSRGCPSPACAEQLGVDHGTAGAIVVRA